MLHYKNHRFHVANVSFQIPDGYFLNTDPEENANNGIRLCNPDKLYSVEIRVDESTRGSEMELAYVLQGMNPRILQPIGPTSVNGIHGHHATYRNTRTQYYELWLDVDAGLTMLVLVVTKADILKIDVDSVVAALGIQMECE